MNMPRLEAVNLSKTAVAYADKSKYEFGYMCAIVKNLKSLKLLRTQYTLFETNDFAGCEHTSHENFPALDVFDHSQSKLPGEFSNWCPAATCSGA
jgi:hypothetical protein